MTLSYETGNYNELSHVENAHNITDLFYVMDVGMSQGFGKQ